MKLIEIIAKLEERHGGANKAAKHFGIDKAYWSRLASGKKSKPSPDVMFKLGIVRTVSYQFAEAFHPSKVAIEDMLDHALGHPVAPPPMPVRFVVNRQVDAQPHAEEIVDSFKPPPELAMLTGITQMRECTLAQMLDHLETQRRKGIADPNFKRSGAFSSQWKVVGTWYYWSIGEGSVQALFNRHRNIHAIPK